MKKLIIYSISIALLLVASIVNAEERIPLFPQSVEIEQREFSKNFPEGKAAAQMTHYRTAAQAEEITRFYENTLQNLGWQLQIKNEQAGLLIFLKEDSYINIVILPNLGQTPQSDFYVTCGNSVAKPIELEGAYSKEEAQKFIREKIQPKVDVPGKDFAWAPRYPGSIRTVYLEDAPAKGCLTLGYTIGGNVSESVEGFYRHKLIGLGWQPTRRMRMETLPGTEVNGGTVFFFKGQLGQCAININYLENEDYTVMAIVYIPQAPFKEM